MQTDYTGFVDRSEWRWVFSVSVTLVLMTLIPFILVAVLSKSPLDNQFMGALHDVEDSAAAMARMQQGIKEGVLLDFLYSPQQQDLIIIHPLYAFLGQLTTFTQLPVTIMFHVLRIFVSLFMYISIYYLGAKIWMKVRPRRIFFVLTSLSSGFGWIIALLFSRNETPILVDLTIPQIFPLYASAANIHYPLAIACVALICAIIIPVLRPGQLIRPSVQNGGIIVFFASLLLAFVYPDALLPLGLAYTLNVGINWWLQKRINRYEWYWGLWILVPSLPIIMYDVLIMANNPYVASWIRQRGDANPSILMLVLGLGLTFIIALPGLSRAVRRFEPDGDRLMLLWLLAMIITFYLPLQLNQYLLLGLMLPIAYFATRAIEDFWFQSIRRVHRSKVYLIIFPFLILSQLVWLFLPVYPAIAGWQGINSTILQNEYGDALRWLRQQESETTVVVLASPDVSLWIPARTGNHVVYGHPDETFNADQALTDVIRWYQQEDASVTQCQSLIDQYHVHYVMYGIREQGIGAGACTDNLTPIATFESITIYMTTATDD
ncbi:MAG: hypothetical protein WBC91_12860 [Phototrophicaceae bacterium]